MQGQKEEERQGLNLNPGFFKLMHLLPVVQEGSNRDFPGGPVVKTTGSQCRHAATKKIPYRATKTWHSQINEQINIFF